MKKIGIITFHCADHHGAVLQCYALRKYLCNKGNDARVINYYPKSVTDWYTIFPSKDTIKRKTANGNIKKLFSDLIPDCIRFTGERISKRRKYDRFRKDFLEITDKKYRTIKEGVKFGYDIYIAGSDQIWNPLLTGDSLDKNYVLSFVEQGKVKASYAASIGRDNIDSYADELVPLVNKLDYVSVREESARKLLIDKDELDKEVEVVIDPVFLLEGKEWEEIIKSIKCYDSKFIFLYMLTVNQEAIDLANELSAKTGYPIVHYFYGKFKKKINNPAKCFYFEGPLELLWYIKNAEYVVTDSFHGTSFSVLFEKEFYIFTGGAKGRICDLLNCLELESRICNGKGIEIIKTNEKIDYSNTKNRIDNYVSGSKKYLEKVCASGGD